MNYPQLVLEILSDHRPRNVIQLSNAMMRQNSGVNLTALAEALGELVTSGQVTRTEETESALPMYQAVEKHHV